MDEEVKAQGGKLLAVMRRFGIYSVILPALFLLLIPNGNMTTGFFFDQDAPALGFGGVVLILLSVFTWRAPPPLKLKPWPTAISLALFSLAVAFAGWWLVFEGYSLSRDELLADFDADILKSGQLIGPIAPAWQGLAPAMMSIHMLEIAPQAGWLSGYLPVNAMLRVLVDTLADRSLTSPLLALLAVLALFGVARRLWPERPPLPILAILLLALSPQFLVTAMTPFAMTGHLALNLVWLWLFLRDKRGTDVAAILVGFLATGLHQIVFHPLFVLPFIGELLLAKRWKRAALYILGYLLIGLFWISYWKIALSLSGVAPAAADTAGESPVLLQRLIMILTANDLTAIPLMVLNLFRFAAWQHILLLPLVLIAWPSIKRGEGIARPLAVGILLILALVLILLPWQGAGWGYRYLHGLLGSFCLLACYGWIRTDNGISSERRRAIFAAASAFTLFLLLPFQLVQTHKIVRPWREASAFIENSGVDIVMVSLPDVEMGDELVRNRPDLSNRPLMIEVEELTREQVEALCKRRRFPLFDSRHAEFFGLNLIDPEVQVDRRFHELGCGVPLPLPEPD